VALSIWLILWGVLAAGLIGFAIWTFIILIRQKKAWRVFAEKRNLRYERNALMESPKMSGVIDGHKISFFTGEHLTPNARAMRKLNAIEVGLNSTMPFTGGVASGGMVPIMSELRWKQEYVPDHEAWQKEYVVSTDERDAMAAYLTDPRVEALCDLMAIKNAWVILIFKDDIMLLRLDTADPLVSAKEIDVLVKRLLKAAATFELKDGEEKSLKSSAANVKANNLALRVDDKVIEAASGIELED